MKLPLSLYGVLTPITKFGGKITVPYIVKDINSRDFYKIQELMQDGDILLSHTKGHLSNLFIEGYWKHAAIVYAKGVVEAVGEGVQFVTLFDFVRTKDAVILLRPKFASAGVCREAALYAFDNVGSPYDYTFVAKNKAFYCSELVLDAYNSILGANNPFKALWDETLQDNVVYPSDFANAKGKIETLYISEKAKYP